MQIRFNLPGKVYLTGAGPGSAKLLTLRALELLRHADLVLHDDLVSDDVLSQIPPHVAVHNVGKRCGSKKITQEEILRRMIAGARAGQILVRLKGGDPLIFARTKDEIAALRQAGIDFEIVPGITAATAAAATAQIPLTDRNNAGRLVFVSNHRCAARGKSSWDRNFTADATLVFYMPGEDFGTLASELMEAGVGEETACLLVSQATRPGQKAIRTTLSGLPFAPPLEAPSLLIVGAVASQARADLTAFPNDASEPLVQAGLQEMTLDLIAPDEINAD